MCLICERGQLPKGAFRSRARERFEFHLKTFKARREKPRLKINLFYRLKVDGGLPEAMPE